MKKISDHIIEHEQSSHQLSCNNNEDSYTEAAKTTATAGIALVAIPGVMALSTTSAGGVLGLIGITTISWPIALVGIGVVGGILALSGNNAMNIKAKATEKLKHQIREMLTERVLIGTDSPSVSQRLQQSIEKATTTYLKEVGHVL